MKSPVFKLLLLVLVFLWPPLAVAQEQVLPEVLAARVSNTPERARLVIDLSARTEFAIVSLDGPNRIAVDVRADYTRVEGGLVPAGEGIVAAAEVQLAEPGRARTMLTLFLPAQVQQAYVLDAFDDQPARLVVDLIVDTPENFAARAAADLAASMAAAQAAGLLPVPGASEGLLPEAVPETPVEVAPETIPEVTAPLVDNSTEPGHSEVAPPVVTGEEVAVRPLVVIDPGHGGVDNGASAPNGTHEKDIVLAFAIKLQELLVATGKYDVALTRGTDVFLQLEERVALARANQADLFISIHADSFTQADIRGASIYTRDERATDILDAVLADNENRSDLVAGFAVPEMNEAVVDVLVDLMRREMRRQSFLAAQAIVAQLEPSVTLRRFPVRQADFFVLQAPDIPSVLLELGFLSNSDDANNLTASGWQERVADALARGISSYFDSLAQE